MISFFRLSLKYAFSSISVVGGALVERKKENPVEPVILRFVDSEYSGLGKT